MPEYDSTIEYRDIHGHPGYKIGNDGSVWTCKRLTKVPRARGGFISSLTKDWKKLRPRAIGKYGHLVVTLRPGSKRFLVHRLVLEAFVGPCPAEQETRHFPDRDPANNHISNLCWGTRSQNQMDRHIQGTSSRGEGFYAAKLNNAMVMSIRERLAQGESQASIARDIGLAASVVSRIHARKSWGHVD